MERKWKDLILQIHPQTNDAIQLAKERYGGRYTLGENVIVQLSPEMSRKINTSVFHLLERIKPGTHARPDYYNKNGVEYVPAMGASRDECSCAVEVYAKRNGELTTGYKICCVYSDDTCDYIPIIIDRISLSSNYRQLSELDLEDVIAIIDSAIIEPSE